MVTVHCEYCGTQADNVLMQCPGCGAPLPAGPLDAPMKGTPAESWVPPADWPPPQWPPPQLPPSDVPPSVASGPVDAASASQVGAPPANQVGAPAASPVGPAPAVPVGPPPASTVGPAPTSTAGTAPSVWVGAPAGPPPATRKRSPVRWLVIGIVGLVVLLAVAVVVFLGFNRSLVPWLQPPATVPETTPTASSGTTGPQPSASPTSPPGEECRTDGIPGSASGAHYELGHDLVPSLAMVWPEISVTCYGSLSSDTSTGVVTGYAVTSGVVTQDITGYAQYLRDATGFIVGGLSIGQGTVSGVLWRNSVDAGFTLRVSYDCSADTCMIRAEKGHLDLAAEPLPHSSSPDPGPWWDSPGIEMTLADGWARYGTWTKANKTWPTFDCYTFAKVSPDFLAGTMLVCRTGVKDLDGDYPTLEAWAKFWTDGYRPKEPVADFGDPTSYTVAGRPVLDYTLKESDTQVREVFLQEGEWVFRVFTVVTPGSGTDPAADIQAMLDSITLTS